MLNIHARPRVSTLNPISESTKWQSSTVQGLWQQQSSRSKREKEVSLAPPRFHPPQAHEIFTSLRLNMSAIAAFFILLLRG